MADPSEIIASNLIGRGLDEFRHLFELTCRDLGISGSPDVVEQIILLAASSTASSRVAKNLVRKLILALQDLPAAWVLPSKNATGVLLNDIDRFVPSIVLGKFDVSLTVILCERVVSNATSIEIWDAVYDLVIEPKVAIPPTVFNEAIPNTLVKSTSGLQHGKEQIHKKLDERILQEVNGCVYNDINGFYEKYFERKSWLPTAKQIIRDANLQTIDGRWIDYPNPPSQSASLEWFWRFQLTFLSRRCSIYYTFHKWLLDSSDCGCQPDLFCQSLDGWSQVLRLDM